jgi:putative FmdB family regulatory protein
MPIYEFLCPACNRVYSFLARGEAGDRQPTCPRCGATDLVKQISRFAVVRGGARPPVEGGGGEGPTGGEADQLDDPRVERELMKLVRDAEHMDENDPRQVGRFMRRMSELTGEPLDAEMEEAVRRLESGEDVDRVEEEMGDLFGPGGADGDFGPSYDEGLYDL